MLVYGQSALLPDILTMCAVGGGDGAGHDAAQRVASGSASTESMARLEHLRNDSYTGRSAGWDDRSGRHGSAGGDRGGGDLDDIDYMSEEAEDDADLSADELASGSDGIRPSYCDRRCMFPHDFSCRARIAMQGTSI